MIAVCHFVNSKKKMNRHHSSTDVFHENYFKAENYLQKDGPGYKKNMASDANGYSIKYSVIKNCPNFS